MSYKIYFVYREHLIDKTIEQSVSNMQNIIEMGRIMRDRKTIPVKVIFLFLIILFLIFVFYHTNETLS